jgi:endonuclease/exonuclease/phosphatase (EEP) superfamily protein YafD
MQSRGLRRPAKASLSAIAAAVGAGAPCAWLARRFWQADLLVHFRLQYVVASLAVGLVLASMGQYSWALIFWLVCGFNALTAWGALAQSVEADLAEPARSSSPTRVRLAAYNVLYRNLDPRRAIDWLRSAALDVVLLQEVTPRWCEALQVLADQFPHRYYSAAWVQHVEGAAGRGALLLSRWPIDGARVVALGRHTEPAIVATLQIQGQALSMIGAHTSWPMGRIVSAERDRQLRLLGDLARVVSGPLVVAGDLNVTPFSPHYQALLAASGLRSAARGRSWQPTWPHFMPACGIQIDHILVSAAIGVERFERGPAMGSDHWPIIADLRVLE